jgi:tetratricopeptide (TPR) repeat protein
LLLIKLIFAKDMPIFVKNPLKRAGMFKNYLILLIFLKSFFATYGLAQTSPVDSLEKKLKYTTIDTVKIKLHLKIAEYLSATQTEKALQNAQKALEIARKNRIIAREVESMLMIGNLFFQQNKPEKSFQQALNALKIAEKARDSTLINDCLVVMSNYYLGQNNYKKSIENLQKALNYFKKQQLGQKIINTALSLGNVYYQNNQLPEAQQNYELALQYTRQTKNYRSLAMCLGNLGNVYDQLKDYPRAIAYYQEALASYRQRKAKFATAWMLGNLGATYYNQKDYANAEKHLAEGRILAQETKALEWLLHNYEYSAKLAEARQDYRTAFDFQKQYQVIKDSIFNDRKSQQINELQTRFETEKKEQENQALKKEQTLNNQIIRNQNFYNYLIFSLLVLVSLIALFLYWARRQVNRQKDLLLDQKEEILQQKEEIEGINEILEQKVLERTNHLLAKNQQLTQYNFINSHKLRAPLARILGLIALFQQNQEALKITEFINLLEISAKALDKIIHEINALLEDTDVD